MTPTEIARQSDNYFYDGTMGRRVLCDRLARMEDELAQAKDEAAQWKGLAKRWKRVARNAINIANEEIGKG